MGIRGDGGQAGSQLKVHTNIAHAQIVIAERKSIFQYLIDPDGASLRLVLASETQKILHDAVGALRLLVELFRILDPLLAHLPAGGQQLAVAQNGRKRVVQFMGDNGYELSDRSELLAMEELFLGAAQIFTSLASFFIQNRALDGAGDLAAGGD